MAAKKFVVDYEAAYNELLEKLHAEVDKAKALDKPELYKLGYSEGVHEAWLTACEIENKHRSVVWADDKFSWPKFTFDKFKGA